MEENIGLFVIDLSECDNTGEIINNVSLALEIPNASGRGISLKLKDNVLNQSQILSIKSLIESYNSQLVNVETTSLITQNACESMGIRVKQTKVQRIQEQTPATETIKEAAPVSETPAQKGIELMPDAEPQIKEPHMHKPEEAKTIKPRVENKFDELKNELRSEATKEKFNKKASAQTTPATETVKEAAPASETPAQEEIDDGLKRQVITVYKKASEVNLQDDEDLEEVDFYAPPTDDPVTIDDKQTIYVNQTLRSGQTLEFDGNIVIIGDCHPGSEIKASGDITVWGVLGSIAHAGSKGNRNAKIRALKMNAVQLRIANCYSRRPDSGNIPYIVKSAVFVPEEARIVDDNIVLFKMANQ